jgi:hypothetical protein
MTFIKLFWFSFIKGIKEVRLMELLDYRKGNVDEILKNELGWEYYGGHHHENLYTKFFQSYYLPTKFRIDKRKTELSAMVRSGHITREEALKEVQLSSYEYDEKVVEYALNKLGLSKKEFDEIMNSPLKSHNDYNTYLPFIRLMRFPILIATKLHILPHILYLKYAK